MFVKKDLNFSKYFTIGPHHLLVSRPRHSTVWCRNRKSASESLQCFANFIITI